MPEEQVDDLVTLNENQKVLYSEISSVKELLKDALTPKEEKEQAKKNEPLTEARLEEIERQRREKAEKEKEALSKQQEMALEIQETMESIEDSTLEWLEKSGLETTGRHERMFNTFLHEAITENKGQYKDGSPKFWEAVAVDVKKAFAESLNLELGEENNFSLPSKANKWSKKGAQKKESKPSSMTMGSDSVSMTIKEKTEYDVIKQKLLDHKEGRATLDREQLYLIQQKLKGLK